MKHKWEILWISGVMLWGLFPIVTIFTYSYISIIYSLAISSFFSILFFLVFFIKNKEWRYFKIKKWWSYLLWSSILNGIIFYLIMFYWLQYTDAINASILWLWEILFAYLFFWILFAAKKSTPNEIVWSIFMIIGTLVVLFPGKINIHYWDIFIILGTMVAPIWNDLARKTIHIFSTNFLMLIRSFLATIFLFIYWYFYSELPPQENLIIVLPYLIFSWVFLFWLSKILFLGALKHISLPRLSSFIVLYPLSTIIYSIILFMKYPTLAQSFGLFQMIIWVLIFFRRIDIEKLFRNKVNRWNT